jgi:hypothetical protein
VWQRHLPRTYARARARERERERERALLGIFGNAYGKLPERDEGSRAAHMNVRGFRV